MKGYKKYILPIGAMGLFLLTGALYPLFSTDSRGVYSLVTDFDKMIPFTKEFIIPYISWYPFIFLSLLYFYIKDSDIYYKEIIGIILGMFISYGIYFVFQTAVPRPELSENDIFTKLVALIYTNDKPFNCFPSLHVLETYLIMKGIKISNCKNKLNSFIINSVGIMIIISTQLVKQHVILDLVFAIILAEIIFNFVYKLDLNKLALNIKAFIIPLLPNKKPENYLNK
ncbi:hypothetical protein HMPREF1982_01649 [Clostridiales bacterium oral taxon 876 str. F0540]|nr:hypothetical protein HMPREF1982_01649 [Clostridiales bacterium oral taxon 876 str. F0540]